MHDYILSTSMALPSPQNGKERDPGKAGLQARKGNPWQNNPAQMLTDQAGSQKHLGEITVLVGWLIVKFSHYPCLSHVLPVIHPFLAQYFQCRTKQSNFLRELLGQKAANGGRHPLPHFAQLFDSTPQGFCICPFPNLFFPHC